jgi:hypothetical protein
MLRTALSTRGRMRQGEPSPGASNTLWSVVQPGSNAPSPPWALCAPHKPHWGDPQPSLHCHSHWATGKCCATGNKPSISLALTTVSIRLKATSVHSVFSLFLGKHLQDWFKKNRLGFAQDLFRANHRFQFQQQTRAQWGLSDETGASVGCR